MTLGLKRKLKVRKILLRIALVGEIIVVLFLLYRRLIGVPSWGLVIFDRSAQSIFLMGLIVPLWFNQSHRCRRKELRYQRQLTIRLKKRNEQLSRDLIL